MHAQRLIQALTLASPVGIFYASTDSYNIIVNKIWSEITGISKDIANNGLWTEAIHPEDKELFLMNWQQAILENKPFRSEHRFCSDTGKKVWVLMQAIPEQDIDVEYVERYIGTITDITPFREQVIHSMQQQKQLAHSSKSSLAEAIAANISHEVKQPLTATMYYLEGVLAKLQTNTNDVADEIIHGITEAIAQTQRAADIVTNMYDFLKTKKLNKTASNINIMIDEAVGLVTINKHLHNINFHLKLADNLPDILIDTVKMQQVIVNLVNNAVDALHSNVANNSKAVIKIVTMQTKNHSIKIILANNGPSIAKEHQAKIFDSFFTTKESGLGMGLAICHAIITAHNGSITVQALDPGTAFTMELPYA